jgi:hypothetical protein
VTGPSGDYFFPALRPSRYDVKFDSGSFRDTLAKPGS